MNTYIIPENITTPAINPKNNALILPFSLNKKKAMKSMIAVKATQLATIYAKPYSAVRKILLGVDILFMLALYLPSQRPQLIQRHIRLFLVRRLAVPFEFSLEFLHALPWNSAGNDN